MFDQATVEMLMEGVVDTLYMTIVSTFFSYVFGIVMAVVLVICRKDGIRPNPVVYSVLDVVVNLTRSFPFLILMIGKLMARAGGPSLADALEVEAAKMVRRHPHVFSDTTYENQSEQLKDWDRIKREEKAAADAEGPKGTYDSLPRGLPPLTKAYRIHSKADRVGFTWPEDEDVEKQVEAEWLELLDAMASDDAEAIEHEFGDHMFTLVELGRRKGIKAAPALNAATERFLTRFERMEALARERNLDFVSLSLDDKDDLWNEVKAAEKPGTEKTED